MLCASGRICNPLPSALFGPCHALVPPIAQSPHQVFTDGFGPPTSWVVGSDSGLGSTAGGFANFFSASHFSFFLSASLFVSFKFHASQTDHIRVQTDHIRVSVLLMFRKARAGLESLAALGRLGVGGGCEGWGGPPNFAVWGMAFISSLCALLKMSQHSLHPKRILSSPWVSTFAMRSLSS